jgi:hypothetical protein
MGKRDSRVRGSIFGFLSYFFFSIECEVRVAVPFWFGFCRISLSGESAVRVEASFWVRFCRIPFSGESKVLILLFDFCRLSFSDEYEVRVPVSICGGFFGRIKYNSKKYFKICSRVSRKLNSARSADT